MSRLSVSAAAAAVLLLVTTTRAAHADIDNPFEDALWVSPGIKVAYTFGEGGGFSYGAEITVMRGTGAEQSVILAHGAALNLGWTYGGTFQLRAGWQLVSWLVGVEAGPALVRRDGQTRLGFGVTPWLGGGFVVPYYTYTLLPGASSFDEAGIYLKLPLCGGCEGGDGFGDGDGDDDDD